jgi:hypothetical protein
MLRFGHEIIFEWSNKRRFAWILIAIALMFVSAYSIMRCFVTADAVSNWIGLPQYAAQITRLQTEGKRWESLAIVLPFFAALILGFGKASSSASGGEPQGSLTYSAESPAERWTAPFVRYLVRLAISLLGTFGFLVILFLIGFVFYKLRIHAT